MQKELHIKTVNATLEHILQIKVELPLPGFMVAFTCALLSEDRHGIPFEQNPHSYLLQVAQVTGLPMPIFKEEELTLDEEEINEIEKFRDHLNLYSLLAILAKWNKTKIYAAYIKSSLIDNRKTFNDSALEITDVYCSSEELLTALICHIKGYKTHLLLNTRLASADQNRSIDEKWILSLVFNDIKLFDINDYSSDMETAIWGISHDTSHSYSTSALVVSSHVINNTSSCFSYIVSDSNILKSNVIHKGKTVPIENRINQIMNDNKQSFLKAVIQLSSDLVFCLDYKNSSNEVFMTNLNGYEFIAEKKCLHDVFFDNAYASKISTQTIINNKFNLNPKYYNFDSDVTTWLKSIEKYEVANLSEVVTFHRSLNLNKFQNEQLVPVKFLEVALSDINNFSRINHPSKVIEVDPSDVLRIKNHGLERKDILFAIKGDIGRIGLYDLFSPFIEPMGEYITVPLMGKGFIGLRIKSKYLHKGLTPEYLAFYLSSFYVKKYIKSLNTGTTSENIRIEDIKSIPVITDSFFIRDCQFTLDEIERIESKVRSEKNIYYRLKKSFSDVMLGNGNLPKERPISLEEYVKQYNDNKI